MPGARRILVTGGTGFLGAAFVARARADGHAAISLDRDPQADICCDIGDPDAVRRAVSEARPDSLVHLAAWLTTDSAEHPVGATRVNALGTAALFAAAQEFGLARVVYASSIAAVGSRPGGSGDAIALHPESLYGVTKAFGEHLASVMALQPGAASYLALRFGWVYGPGRARGWRDVQDLVERVASGARVIEYPDYPEPIDWTWVDDAVEVLMRGVTQPSAAFAALNVAGDKRLVRDAVAHLARRFPDLVATSRPARTPPSAWHLVNDRIGAVLGYAPDTTLEDGLDQLIAACAGMTDETNGAIS